MRCRPGALQAGCRALLLTDSNTALDPQADPLVVDVDLGLADAVDGLAPGLYRLFVCDTITDAAGNALDGNGDSTPGGDFELPFFRADPFLGENGLIFTDGFESGDTSAWPATVP